MANRRASGKGSYLTKLQTVLCVDDEPDVRSVVQMCLEMVGGFTVITAVDGLDGVEKASTHIPDFILLDVMMPNLAGPDALVRMRKDDSLDKTPIAFMTAITRPEEVKKFYEVGANEVIAKPFDPMELPTRVQDIWASFHGAS